MSALREYVFHMADLGAAKTVLEALVREERIDAGEEAWLRRALTELERRVVEDYMRGRGS